MGYCMIDVLDRSEILLNIDSNLKQYIAKLDVFATIDSTNDYLLNQAKHKLASGTICIADEQTQGRGRQGKKWESPQGMNVYFSMSWNFANTDTSALSLAIGVIVAKALLRLGVPNDIQLKWPNDIYYQNRKLAGLLIEAVGNTVVIGIGLNVFMQKPETISLSEISETNYNRNRIIAALIEALIANLPFYMNHGFSYFYNEYQQYDMLSGRSVVVRDGKYEIVGLVEGITEKGVLQLRDQKGMLHNFNCGEVSVII